ncbi:MAG: Crp/Fnr family transcriptional regulator [Thiomicrospira sp.]|jgi:CRP-like cAMP-binding protein|nr:Crp/Fnr family transcriptional regulator [Thiomicrospira sp.]
MKINTAPSLGNITLLKSLNSDILNTVQTQIKYSRFKKSEFVIRKGDESSSLLFLIEGELSVVDINIEGQLFWLATISAGEHFGELGLITGQARNASLVATTDVLVGMLRKEDALKLILNHPSIAWKIMHRMAEIIEQNNSNISLINLPTAQERIEALLSKHTVKYANGMNVVENLPSQQTLASMTNTSRETVSRVISKLIKQGVLEKDIKRLIIRKPEKLRDLTH